MGGRVKNIVLSKFMGIMRPVSVIFDNGATYSCYSNMRYFVYLEYNPPPRKLKSIYKYIETYRFGIVEYSVRIDSEHIITLQDQA